MKKSKFKVKVTNYTPNVDGTVMHDKMKNYHNLNSNMKQRIERDGNNQKNKSKLNDNNGKGMECVVSKHNDNLVKKTKKNIKKSQIIESDSSDNEDTTPIMQLLKKSPSERNQSDEDLTPISQLFIEKKMTPKKNYLQIQTRGMI